MARNFWDERQLVIARPKFGGEIFGERVIPGTTQSMPKEDKSIVPGSTMADKCDSQVLATYVLSHYTRLFGGSRVCLTGCRA
jgi:hypothetical protein